MARLEIRAHFDGEFHKGYIAHPYWPAVERVVTITRNSGANRARTPENREKAMNQYLASIGLSNDDWLTLQRESQEPWYRDPETNEIVISEHQVMGMLAQAAKAARAAIRVAGRDQIRSLIRSTDWHTGKHAADGKWERYAVVQGAGGKLSNQRGLRSNEYIGKGPDSRGEGFTATGELEIPDNMTEKIEAFLRFCGTDIGLGASRNMGWGRFDVDLTVKAR